MTDLVMHSAECPKMQDGRMRHYFVKVDGKWTCLNCGEVER